MPHQVETEAPLYISQGGRVSCTKIECAGSYLHAAAEREPGKFNYFTPLDHWQRAPENARIEYELICEGCGQ